MPAVEDWKKEADKLIKDIEDLHKKIVEYRNTGDVKSPYDIVKYLGQAMRGASGIVPVTWISKALDFGGKFLISWAEKNAVKKPG